MNFLKNISIFTLLFISIQSTIVIGSTELYFGRQPSARVEALGKSGVSLSSNAYAHILKAHIKGTY